VSLVNLTYENIIEIASIANQRQLNKRQNNVKEQAFKPEINKGFKLDFFGLLGEFAVSKIFNIEIDKEIYLGGDKGYDLLIHGKKIDVKTTTVQNVNKTSLIVKPSIHCRKTSHFYVLCRINDPLQIEILGCMSWGKFDKQKKIRDFGTSEAYCVPANELSKIQMLSEYFSNLRERT